MCKLYDGCEVSNGEIVSTPEPFLVFFCVFIVLFCMKVCKPLPDFLSEMYCSISLVGVYVKIAICGIVIFYSQRVICFRKTIEVS